jgi:imidazolonepropionase-like amidohydrolase
MLKSGIARGTGTFVTLSESKENLVVLKDKASAHYSFNKGTSTQAYPSSAMGSIALLRQTYLDAVWYKTKPAKEGLNLSLQSWNDNQSLPQIFEADDKWNEIRADRIGDEFSIQYIIKGGGNEYQRIKEIAATKATFIVGVNYPQAMDVEDPNDARAVSLSDMKHWELAPTNLAALEKANIPFCITSSDLKDNKSFITNLRKAIDFGLSETKALEALTKTPASLLGVFDKVGSLETGKLANIIISTGPIFAEKTAILQNWVAGEKYAVKEDQWLDVKGNYTLSITSDNGPIKYILDVKNTSTANVIGKDTFTSKFSYDGKQVKLSFSPVATKKPADAPAGGFKRSSASTNYRLSGMSNGTSWTGTGEDTVGNKITWTATFDSASNAGSDSTKKKQNFNQRLAKVTYPFDGYGWEEAPKQETILIKNATIWTNEKEGILENADLLLKDGKIAKVGKNLLSQVLRTIDATGKHVTAGIIDEHSHIAASSINEGAQSVTSEVRIGDNMNPEDINIYRQLSGGVTSSHILHGSANTIGGQTQLIKLRWGADDEGLKFKGSDPFIKFALGENVKRTTATQGNNRFPIHVWELQKF